MIYINKIKDNSISPKIKGNGGNGIDWSQIGLPTVPDILTKGMDDAQKVYDNWNPENTSAKELFIGNDISIAPKLDTHNVTNFDFTFQDSSLMKQPEWDLTSGVSFYSFLGRCPWLSGDVDLYIPNAKNINHILNCMAYINQERNTIGIKTLKIYTRLNGNLLEAKTMDGAFAGQYILEEITGKNGGRLSILNPESMFGTFAYCSLLSESPMIHLDNCTELRRCFQGCEKMNKIWLIGNASKLTPEKIVDCFDGVAKTGTLYVGLDKYNRGLFEPEINKDGRNWEILQVG